MPRSLERLRKNIGFIASARQNRSRRPKRKLGTGYAKPTFQKLDEETELPKQRTTIVALTSKARNNPLEC